MGMRLKLSNASLTLKKIITPYGVKRDRSVKFTQSNSTWSKFYSISSKILLFLQSDPLFTPYGVITFYRNVNEHILPIFLINFINLFTKKETFNDNFSKNRMSDLTEIWELGLVSLSLCNIPTLISNRKTSFCLQYLLKCILFGYWIH